MFITLEMIQNNGGGAASFHSSKCCLHTISTPFDCKYNRKQQGISTRWKRRIISATLVLAGCIAVENLQTSLLYALKINGVLDTEQQQNAWHDAPTPTGLATEKQNTMSSIISQSENNNQIKVLIARTVGVSEVENVVDDVMKLNSYSVQSSHSHDQLIERSISQCHNIQNFSQQLEQYHNFTSMNLSISDGLSIFPNKILCHAGNKSNSFRVANYFEMIRLEFLFFARNTNVALDLSSKLSEHINVEIIDTSIGESTAKLWMWLTHLNEERLVQTKEQQITGSYKYNYVWPVDGDILLRSLNWLAFWQQIQLMKPKIAQPVPLFPNGYHGTIHPILHRVGDTRQIAGETAMVSHDNRANLYKNNASANLCKHTSISHLMVFFLSLMCFCHFSLK